MIPVKKLHQNLTATTDELDRYGEATWQYAEDWRKSQQIGGDSSRGGGRGDSADRDALVDRRDDAKAARLADVLDKLTARIDADLAQLRFLLLSNQPVKNAAALLVTEDNDWCRSCLRIQRAEPRKAGDLCEFCWSHQKETHRLPDVDLLRARHEGRPLRVKA